jgi:uncharacterized membrane protein
MATLVAIAYPDEYRAAEVLAALKRLESQYLVDLEDAVYVVKDKVGKLKLHQTVNLTAAGAVGGALWGGLIGLLFLMPVAGLAVGAAAGALSGALSDYGIDDNFVKGLAEEIKPGSSAIFMLVKTWTFDKVEPELAKFGGKILTSNVSNDMEQKFQAALDAANATMPDEEAPTAQDAEEQVIKATDDEHLPHA